MNQEKREALDRVFEAAQSSEYSTYEFAIWILYRLAKIDATSAAEEAISSNDSDAEYAEAMELHSVHDELEGYKELICDDDETALAIAEDQMALGEALDPDFSKPVLSPQEIERIKANRPKD